MAEGAEPAQNRRHQPPHQRAVAIGERLQPGMRGGAVELVVERAVLMQDAVEDIRRDPARREAEAGRKAAEANAKPAAKEFQGPKGPEPTRYGDWENNGIASDF